MSLKFKGVVTKKGPTYGDIIESSPAEKTIMALQDAVVAAEEFKDKIHVWLRDITITKVEERLLGNLLGGKWAHNTYRATGTAAFHRRDLNRDVILPPIKAKYDIEFLDTLNHNGLPDLRVSKFTYEK